MIEILETRIAPATLTWIGASTPQWSAANNWTPTSVPAPGDTLIFNDSAVATTLLNDTPDGTPYSLLFNVDTNNYIINGNGVSFGAGGGLTKNGAGTVTLNISLTGSGGVTENGGLLELNRPNPFSGGITIAGGVLRVLNDTNLGAPTGDLTILSGATLETVGSLASVRSFHLGGNANIAVQGGTDFNISGLVTDAGVPGALAKLGPGNLTLSNPGNSFTGDINVASGVLRAVGAAPAVNPVTSALGNPQTSGRVISIAPGATLSFDSSDILGLDGSTPAVTLAIGGTVTNSGKFNTLGPISLSGTGVLTGTGGLSKTKQMYSLTGDINSDSGGLITAAANGAFAGYHLGAGVSIASNNAPLVISAVLLNQTPANGSAPGVLQVNGTNVVSLGGANTFSGGVSIESGTLRIASDANLGATVGGVSMLAGSQLEVVNSIASARNFTIGGAVNFLIPLTKTLTLSGVISDGVPPGSFSVIGGGKIILTNTANTISGGLSVTGGSLTYNGITSTIAGGGTATITPIPGTTGIASVVLTGTTLSSTFKITGPATTEVYKISIPSPTDHIDLIQLGNEILFGDGVADALPDLFIAGQVKRVVMGDVNGSAIFKFGDGLPYDVDTDNTTPDTYNNRPDVTLRDMLGEGITIDVTGDGTEGGVGGGGLGKFKVRSWGFPGLVKTTQSIDTFTIQRGDSYAVLEVDKFHNGVLTPANVNKITCLAGKWNSAGTAIEGYVGKFDVGGFAIGATLTAGYIQTRLFVKGTHLEIGNIAFGGIVTLTSPTPSALLDIRVGSFDGVIDAEGTIANFSGTGNFSGTLIADAIVTKVKALNFVDNGVNFARITTTSGGIGSIVATAGGMTNTIIQSAAGIGAITLTGSGATRSMIGSTISAKGSITGPIKIGTTGSGSNLDASVIISGADLGADGLLGGLLLNADEPWVGGTSIGDISVYGVMTGSAIAASIDPGIDATYGNPLTYAGGNDAAVGGGGAIGKVSLHSSAFTGKTTQTDNSIAHTNVIMGSSINGVFQLPSTAKIAALIFAAADVSRDLRSGGSPAAGDLLFYTF